MSSRFKTPIIDDITALNIDAVQQENLLDLFEYAMQSMATTLAREANFDTTDFATARLGGCEGFTLQMRRALADSRDSWLGTFLKENQRLDVMGHLEP
ncbi:hypothetical protein BYI23_B010900 [Burkholderia sp. YI23]|nr:hypothetical protein BYI23_B010900 [Burkholderia sp. YI23]